AYLLTCRVRQGLRPGLEKWSRFRLRASSLSDPWGSSLSGFYTFISGTDRDGRPLLRRRWMIARAGDGPNIPCMPAILIARRLAGGEALGPGARPCLDLITLEEFLAALEPYDVSLVEG